ncbi:hypothetical protein HanIR_Chr06g0265621 [Helianthus annuus]|nr:hypothetical protein HanIR_Chr06g0265621 [Helianthus annuus]
MGRDKSRYTRRDRTMIWLLLTVVLKKPTEIKDAIVVVAADEKADVFYGNN